MKDLDKWAAEKCGVQFSRLENNQIASFFMFNVAIFEYEWTLEDARCREIVREHFKIWTSYGIIDTDTMGWIACSAYEGLNKYFGKTIAEAEIACIEAIMRRE